MKKLFYGLIASLALSAPVVGSELITKGWRTNDSLGCMLLRECTDGVVKINSIADVKAYYDGLFDYDTIGPEFNKILAHLDAIGVEVFLAPEKYFPPMNRGVYHAKQNKFFLNDDYMTREGALMATVRHEGWHVAQDCMAAGVENTFLAVIYDDDQIPYYYREMAERRYPPSARPWEQEAIWAGYTANVTEQALAACASDRPMWETYEPTPMTREWLVNEGHITE